LVRRAKVSVRGGAAFARRPRALARFAVLVAALALFGQLLALPYHHPQGQTDRAEVVALLKATFGDAAVLCVTTGDDAAHGAPEHRHNHGDGGCPLCQFAAQTVLFEAPAPSLPQPVAVATVRLIPRGAVARWTSKPRGLAQPRAPPLEA
jgi:hypothetical protein